MDDEELKTRFREELPRLTMLDGVSGHEGAVVRYLRDSMQGLADSVEVDPLGNLYATRGKGAGPHLMICAHSDEIGSLVAAIERDGFLRLLPVGGLLTPLMIGRKVRVRGYRGVIGVRSGHLQSLQERHTAPEIEDLYVDLGLQSREEVEALGVRVGDQVTWQSELEPTANPDRLVGKAVDNRIGCLIVLELLRLLRGEDVVGTLTVVVAVQEEVGLKGAAVAAERVRPDAALVVDTVPCADTPDSRHVPTFPIGIGRGTVIQTASGDHASGFLMPEVVRDYVIRVADAEGIPYQLATFPYANTDAGSIYVSAGGIPTVPATIPRRYSHSPVEMLDLNDAVATLRLVLAIVRQAGEFPRSFV